LTAVGGAGRVWVAAAEDYFINTPFRRLMFGGMLDGIAVDRHSSGVAGLRRCGQALCRGDGLLVFPEGTRSIDGRIQAFKIGVALLAVERQAPIVPVHIDRAYDLLPKGRRFAHAGVITVTFGKPIHPPAFAEITDHYAAFGALTSQVQQTVVRLSAEASQA
ncbi:MAG: 1-acyl-sn-glycerol-3-phosphate acyltransferase, partial [Planctomycetes bacterium]|nr:1-acyl-sn-glycerol-3-phosphate acyltransferase [Planctomycetota bacterium]